MSNFRQKIIRLIALIALLVVIFLIGASLGQYGLSLREIFDTLIGKGTEQSNLVIFTFRLPRLCLAILVGFGMGTSGVILQSLLHNDMASPGTLGVADGSSVFLTVYVAFISQKITQPIMLPFLALIGGLMSSVIIYFLSTNKGKPVSSTKLIMNGVALSAGYSALSMILMYLLDESQLEFMQRWQSGELWGTQWNYIAILFVWLLLFGGVALYQARKLNAIALGYDVAEGLGVGVKKSFILLGFMAVAISSASVAFGGNFFFLGLIGPHIARRIVGPDARILIPTASVVSSVIIVAANILVENVEIFMNIPTGIFVSILAVPYFLYLLLKG